MKCDKCNGIGHVTVLKPVSLTSKENVDVECDICNGTGEIPDNYMDMILGRLDRIISLLGNKKEV